MLNDAVLSVFLLICLGILLAGAVVLLGRGFMHLFTEAKREHKKPADAHDSKDGERAA